MTWHDLLFMHWPISTTIIRSLLPSGLELDLFDGRAWIGVIPFYMSGVRPRLVPSVVASKFPEVNVRTYARHDGKSGVWFFSLDAASRLAVWGARRFFHLPYHFAAMSVSISQNTVDYRSERLASPETRLVARYEPVGTPARSAAGSLEHWLTERYCLFAVNKRGKIFRGDIHHQPWSLQCAEVEIQANTMTRSLGIALPSVDPLVHFAKRQDVWAWPLE
jgi:uncharacterized protein YqjF (DUF2071 family)